MNDNNAHADNELRDWAYDWKLHCHRASGREYRHTGVLQQLQRRSHLAVQSRTSWVRFVPPSSVYQKALTDYSGECRESVVTPRGVSTYSTRTPSFIVRSLCGIKWWRWETVDGAGSRTTRLGEIYCLVVG
jgi:hypothetical protein